MLDKYLNNLLLNLCRAEEFRPLPTSADRAAWEGVSQELRERAVRAGREALDTQIPALTASAYMRCRREGNSEEYLRAHRTRRGLLRALALACCLDEDPRLMERLVDLIWAICEESSWVLPANDPRGMSEPALPLPEVAAPLVDLAAAQAASDLTATCLLLEERLNGVTPQLIERVGWEIEARILTPLLALEGASFLCGPKADMLECLCGALLSVLRFERDGRRRWHAVRKVWVLLDRLLSQLPQDGSIPGGVGAWLEVAAPVAEMLSMAARATRGEVDPRGEPLIQYIGHYPVFCHMAEGWFINPGRASMRPQLNGAAMYRVGVALGDGALCDLGAVMHRKRRAEPEPEPSLLRAAQNVLSREALERADARPPFRAQGYLNAMELMTARIREDEEGGLALSMRGGNNGQIGCHADVGDFMLFCGGRPVFVDAGCHEDTRYHNLPTIGEVEQAYGAAFRAQDVICRLERDYAMLSLSLAAAYPEAAGIDEWQRSAILSREDGVVQLIDVFDLKLPARVRFHFVSPIRPALSQRYAQLGPVRMRWEEGLAAEVDELPVAGAEYAALWGETLYLLTLTTPNAVDRGKYTFTMHALRTFGR